MKVEGDPAHPFTRGFLCGKCYNYPQHVHSPDRLTQPLVRDGPKGSGRFRPATWEEALDLVVRKMKEAAAADGPASILPHGYAGHEGILSARYPFRFFRAIGATALTKTICEVEGMRALLDCYGGYPGFDERDIDQVDLYVFWGVNPVHSAIHVFHHVKTSGVPFWVVDPVRTATAREASLHLAPRPGSDAALALAMAGVILRDGREDLAFRTIDGATAFEAAARAMTPERAAALSGLPATTIERAARAYADARAPILHLGIGLQHGEWGYAAFAAAIGLANVAGKTRLGGGLQFIGRQEARGAYDLAALEPPAGAPAAPRSVTMTAFGRALTELTDPPIRVLYVFNSNPAASAPDQRRVLRGLAREDLFTVVHDLFLTDTARWADVVLPATSAFETEDFAHAWYGTFAGHCRPVVPPVGESRSNFDVARELALRWGLAGFDDDQRTFLRRAVRLPDGRGLDDLGESPLVIFARPAADSATRAKRLVAPELAPPPQPGEDEVVLVGMKDKRLLTTQFANVPAIARSFAGVAVLTVHPEDARRLGLADRELVEASTSVGACRFRLRVAEETPPGVAWTTTVPPPALIGGANLNALIPDTPGRHADGALFNGQRVRLRPVT